MTDDTETNQPDAPIKSRESQKHIDYDKFGKDLTRWLNEGQGHTVQHIANNLSTRPADFKHMIATLAKGEKVNAKRGVVNDIANFCRIEIHYIDKALIKASTRDKIHSRGNRVETAKSPNRDADSGREV